jgi:hypothetical protein
MIAHAGDSPKKLRLYNDKLSTPMAELMRRVGEAYTDMSPILSGWSPYSDHAPFSYEGYPAVFVQEYDGNMRLHTPNDLLVHLDMDYAADVVEMVLATVLHLGTLADPPETIAASQTLGGDVLVEWDHSTDADLLGYHVEVTGATGEVIDKLFTVENYITLESNVIGDMAWVSVSAQDVLGEGAPSERVLVGSEAMIALAPWPNPARGSCCFEFFLPGAAGVVKASLLVFDAAGRLVRTLHEGDLRTGPQSFEWLGVYDDGTRAPDGIYFYSLDVDGIGRTTGKIVMVN